MYVNLYTLLNNMRNYIWISEFKKQEQVNKLEFFDDEYFVILKNNQPIFIAYPNLISKEVENKFQYEIDMCSARDITTASFKVLDKHILHILKNNSKYYNIIPFWREVSSFIDRTILEKVRAEHLSILKN